MVFADYISPERIVFLKSTTKEEAFAELADAVCRHDRNLDKLTVLQKVLERESLVTTKLAPGIAMPHAKFESIALPLIIVGVSRAGIQYETGDPNPVHLMIMILSDTERYLPILSSIATHLTEHSVYEQITASANADEVSDLLKRKNVPVERAEDRTVLSWTVMDHACRLYEEINAKALVVYAGDPDDKILDRCRGKKLFIITDSKEGYSHLDAGRDVTVVHVPFGKLSRTGRIELGQLFIAAKNLLEKGDRVISIYGKKNPDLFDTLMVSNIENEYADLFSAEPGILPDDLKEEVFARAVQLLGDLAAEGREGKPVGTIFILADHERVSTLCQQMVINPFKGIDEEERNILDPGLEETIKEFSKMDGAFIIRGDGVLLSSGSYLSAHMPDAELIRGLGARHAAAAGITSASDAIGLVLSESTRKISLFRAGKRFTVF